MKHVHLILPALLPALLAVGSACDRPAAPVAGPSAAPAASAAAPTVALADAAAPPVASSNTSWRAVVTGRMPVAGAAWTKGGAAVIVTQKDIWTIDPSTPDRAHVTPLSRSAGESASIAAREDSDLVAVGLGDGSIDVFVASVLVKTLPPVVRGAYSVHLKVTDDGKSLIATSFADHGRVVARSFDLHTFASTPIAHPDDPPPASAPPLRVPRADQAFVLVVQPGVEIVEPSGHVVLAWGTEHLPPAIRLAWRHDAIEAQSAASPFSPFYHFADSDLDRTPEVIPPPTGCVGKDGMADLMDAEGGAARYVVQKDWIGGICFCTNAGCQMTWLTEPPPGPAAEPLIHEVAIGLGGGRVFLSKTTADDEPKNVVTLHPANVKAKSGSFGCTLNEAAFAGDRIFATCYGKSGTEILELSPKNLAVLARRHAPEVVGGNVSFRALGSKLYYGSLYADEGDLLDPDWIGDPGKVADGHLFLWKNVGVLRRADGTLQIAGQASEADREIRCYDGETFAPFAACKDALLARL